MLIKLISLSRNQTRQSPSALTSAKKWKNKAQSFSQFTKKAKMKISTLQSWVSSYLLVDDFSKMRSKRRPTKGGFSF